MFFRLLGPLEVTDGDGPIRIGGGRQRSVLVMLLLHRNAVVGSERLVDALWGEAPPPTAAKVLQNSVGQLRRALDDRTGERLQTRGHGYALRIAAGELDVDRFEELVREGGRALADGRSSQAAARLLEALSLWRGSPLADVSYEAFAQPEIARLEELFATALERRIEADLALGAHADVVSELEALVARDPVRERFRALLMLALYRCGRQADALAVFREGRRLLIDEVGVEPGRELRDLHEAILRQEPGLELERPELPRELDVTGAPALVGRDRELAWLLDWWYRARQGDGAAVALTGESGIGKSRLAAELAGAVHRAGGLVRYAPARGCAEAVADAVGWAGRVARPMLVVVEDAATYDLGWPSPEDMAARAALVLVTADAPERLAGPSVAGSLALTPLDRDAVATIASTYAPGGPGGAVPTDELFEASDGVPRRVHEAASRWAAAEAARRVVDIAPQAAAERSALRTVEEGLAGRLRELQEARERLDHFTDDAALVVCPFKGLASFEFADAPYFSGRERLIAELVARAVGAPLLGLVGPSGSGKSSLVKAGLLPALASGVLPGSAAWSRTIIRPGEHPMRELARLEERGVGGRVLVIDQFEELFTACRDEHERVAFVEALVAAAGRRDGDGLVVVAVRADYYGRCAAYPALSRLLALSHVLVGSLDAHELRRAIERPAARAGLKVDRELVDAIVADVDGEPGALPLLSSALLELWQRRDGRRLRRDTYEATGGVRGAVARLAESAFAKLDPGQQRVARDVLVRLAADGPGGEVVRRRVELVDLHAEGEGEIRAILELLADHRLLTLSATSVEVAHEALLREWPRLHGWLEADAQSRRVHRHLAQAAADWQERGRDRADLYRGARLAVAREWRASHVGELSATEQAFLDASATAAEREQRRLRVALAGVVALLAAATVAAIVAVHQRGAAQRQARTAEAQRVSLQALTEPDLARSLLLAREGVALADSPFTRGNLLGALLSRPAAVAVVRGEGSAVEALDVDRQGRTLVMGDTDGNVEIFDLATRRQIGATLKVGGPVTAVTLSPDGSRLAVTSLNLTQDGVLRLLDAHTLANVRTETLGYRPYRGYRPYVAVADPVFSPDSRMLAADIGEEVAGSSIRRDVVQWDARTGRPLRQPQPISPPVSPDSPIASDSALGGYIDGRAYLVTSSAADDTTVIRDAGSLRTVRRIAGGGNPAAVSPDGRFVALTSATRPVRLLDLHTGRLRALGRGPAATVVRFTPNSRNLVTADRDARLTVWNVTSATPPQTIAQLAGGVSALAISADGTTAYTGDEHGGLSAWDLTGRRGLGQPLRLPGHRPVAVAAPTAGNPLLAVADAGAGLELLDTHSLAPARQIPVTGGADAVTVAPDVRTAAFGTRDGSVGYVDVRTGRLLETPEPSHINAVRDLTFSPDGRRLATTDGSVVYLWDVHDTRPIDAFTGVVGIATSLRFSPDGQTLVVADDRTDGSGALDELAIPSLELVRQVLVPPVIQMEFSRDGKILFTADQAGRVWLLDARMLQPIGAPLLANASRFAIDPTDRLLATSSNAGAVQLWDVRSGLPQGGTLPGAGGAPAQLAFVAGGSALVTLGTDGTGTLWDVRPQAWERRACDIAGRPLTAQEWQDALPGLSYSPACTARR
jgi:DNA-binding SARP family transcriptional activator/WD40 repeat protein/energy-coupling factor transporter ATP-binding protein EcfA2